MAEQEFYEPPNATHFEGFHTPRHITLDTLKRLKSGDFKFRDDDVIMISYAKSGCTWVQFILYLLYRLDELDGDLTEFIDDFILFLEVTRHGKPCNLDLLDAMPTEKPRVIKTHIPHSVIGEHLLKTKAKMVLVSRNPKDMLVSNYHFYQLNALLGNYTGTWDQFFELFRNKKLVYGDWIEFTTEWWECRKHADLLHVQYEDLLRNPKDTIKQLANFLGKDVTDEQLDKLVKATSFGQMKANKKANMSHIPVFNMKVHNFMRKGQVGDWKNFFTDEQSEYVDKLMREHIQGTGMEFYFGEEN